MRSRFGSPPRHDAGERDVIVVGAEMRAGAAARVGSGAVASDELGGADEVVGWEASSAGSAQLETGA
jgi:hypothetical protein